MRGLVFFVRSELCSTSFSPHSFKTWYLIRHRYNSGGRDSAIDMQALYGMRVWRFSSRLGRVFLLSSRPAPGPTHPVIKWAPRFSPRVELPGTVTLTTQPHLLPSSGLSTAIRLLPPSAGRLLPLRGNNSFYPLVL